MTTGPWNRARSCKLVAEHASCGSTMLPVIIALGAISLLVIAAACTVSSSLARRRILGERGDALELDDRFFADAFQRYLRTFETTVHDRIEEVAIPGRSVVVVTGSAHGTVHDRPAWDVASHTGEIIRCETSETPTREPYSALSRCRAILPALHGAVLVDGDLAPTDPLRIIAEESTPTILTVLGAAELSRGVMISGAKRGRVEIVSAGSMTVASIAWPGADAGEVLLHSAAGEVRVPDEAALPAGVRVRAEGTLITVAGGHRTRFAWGPPLEHPSSRWRRFRVIGAAETDGPSGSGAP